MPSSKSNAQKLLVKPGNALMVVNPPRNVDDLLGPLPAGVAVRRFGGGTSHVILYFSGSRTDLESQLPGLKAFLEPGGIIWVAYHKGTSKMKTDISRDSINAYSQTLGMTGVAMISLDDDWSAMRLRMVD
jgi:hypothetical protein